MSIAIILFSGQVLSYETKVPANALSLADKRTIQTLVLDSVGMDEATHFVKLLYNEEQPTSVHAFVKPWAEHDQECRATCKELLNRAVSEMDFYYLNRVVENGISDVVGPEKTGQLLLECSELFLNAYRKRIEKGRS